MTTTNNSAIGPVAKIRVGGGPDPSTVMWITDSPPNTPILVYTAADYDALRAEVRRVCADYTRLERDYDSLGYILSDKLKEATARAYAAEAKVTAFMELLPEVESRIRAAVKCMPGSKQCVIAKIELEEAGAWLEALNENNSAGRGEGL